MHAADLVGLLVDDAQRRQADDVLDVYLLAHLALERAHGPAHRWLRGVKRFGSGGEGAGAGDGVYLAKLFEFHSETFHEARATATHSVTIPAGSLGYAARE